SPAQKSEPGAEDANEQDSPQHSGSRMSFLRSAGPASPTGSNNGRQSPSLFRTQLFAKHRRQHSMPSPTQTSNTPQSPRTLQHLAAANRASAAGHSRGMSVSVLRSPPVVSSGLQYEMQPFSDQQQQQQQQISENEPLLGDESSESNSDVDPDIISSGAPGDPRMHTKASEDVPVSDLQALPSSRLIMDGQTPPTAVFRARAEWFLRCMALCHTVQPDRDPLTGRITGYQATSPDEKALVAAAAELGFVMNNRAGPLVQLRVVASERMRDFNQAVINDIKSGSQSPAPTTPVTASTAVPLSAAEISSTPLSAADLGSPPATAVAGGDSAAGTAGVDGSVAAESEQSFDRGVPAPHPTDRLGNYEVLDVLEFSSARKRMSVILRCPDGRIVMMSKGADSAIWPRLCPISQLQSDPKDISFMPRPTPPADKFPAPQPLLLRRKLSQPSAAYLLHSRNASVASSMQSRDGETMPESAGLAYPPKAVARLNDGTMYFGQLGESSSPSMPSPLADEATEGGLSPLIPMSAPANGTFATMRQAPQHRRLMSDSQFSALSEASSFADTQGQIEISPSFQTPTAEEEEWARARALEALHQFSTEGLRTLAYAHKEIPAATYEAWHTRYLAATTALNNRQEQVEAVCEEIEGDLLLSGVSAIEDRLQEGVPETIFKLRRAGIRVWMLTGDKVETAINIAKSCRLIETDVVETTSLDPQTVEKCKDKMMLLIMQSLSDPDALERIITRALEVARTIGASVDQRFERRSRREKLRRGLKKFGNMLMLRRKPQVAEAPDLVADTELKD
ncbi:drs2 neo1 protein, partial [Coemansia brasiliensis]